MEIKPLAAKVTANGSGNKTTVGSATNVYVCSTATDLITNVTTGATMQVPANFAFVLRKEKGDEVHAGSTNTHFTKIAYPRG